MFEVHHRVDDLEVGQSVLWNGRAHEVTTITDVYVEFESIHKVRTEKVNSWFKNEDVPFEVLDFGGAQPSAASSERRSKTEVISMESDIEVTYEDGDVLRVSFESSGVMHVFKFSLAHFDEWDESDRNDRVAWPEMMIQDTERHHLGVNDVPEIVKETLEDEGYKLEEG